MLVTSSIVHHGAAGVNWKRGKEEVGCIPMHRVTIGDMTWCIEMHPTSAQLGLESFARRGVADILIGS